MPNPVIAFPGKGCDLRIFFLLGTSSGLCGIVIAYGGFHRVPVMSAATILVIDDDKLSRWSLSTLLGRAGHVVREAATGKEGLASLQEAAPQLVLLDIELPDMDGFAVLEKIRLACPDLPVLMMTADPTAESARRALRLGAQGQLHKPIDSVTLEAAVAQALKSSAPPGYAGR